MNILQVLVRCYEKVATRSVSATNFGREAPASVTRRAARRYCPGLAGVRNLWTDHRIRLRD